MTPTRPITLRVSSPRDIDIQSILRAVKDSGYPGAFSVGEGVTMCPDLVEKEFEIILHEATPELTLAAWQAIRALPGFDCARIYDSGLSWCAKSYDNFCTRNNTYPEHNFDPVEYI